MPGPLQGDEKTQQIGTDESARILLVVDGHAFAYRAFHAIQRLASPEGAPTNAIFGFIKTLAKVRALTRPSHQVVVWDGGLAAERLAMLPEYKAQRPPMPADLARQLDGIIDFLEGARIAWQRQDGVEADDLIATLAEQASADGVRVIIASPDKDFMQLVSDQVGLFNPTDKSEAVWGPAEVQARTGVEPKQIVDWLSLIGDAVDNIPGVPGIGPKTATNLLRQYGAIQGIYARLGEVESSAMRERLVAAAEQVRRNQELIRLKNKLPGLCRLAELAVKPADEQQLRCLYKAWGFQSLLKELDPLLLRQAELF